MDGAQAGKSKKDSINYENKYKFFPTQHKPIKGLHIH
jgi:hypothetical protein